MSSVTITKTTADIAQKTMEDTKNSLDKSDMVQKIRNNRRQTEYDMGYTDWANYSIRVMASYTLMLVATLIVLVIIYFYGGAIADYAKKTMGTSDATAPATSTQ